MSSRYYSLSALLYCPQCVGFLLYNPKVGAAGPVIMTLFQHEKLQNGSQMKPGTLPCTQATSPAPTLPPKVGEGQLLGRGGKVHAKFGLFNDWVWTLNWLFTQKSLHSKPQDWIGLNWAASIILRTVLGTVMTWMRRHFMFYTVE